MFLPYCSTFNAHGATSKSYDKPNQDSARGLTSRLSENGLNRSIHSISIADGHGGIEHKDSDQGSDIATQVIVRFVNTIMFFNQPIDCQKKSLGKYVLKSWTKHIKKKAGPKELYGTTIRAIIFDENAQKAALIACGDGHTFIKYKGVNRLVEWPEPYDYSCNIPEASESLSTTNGSSIRVEYLDFHEVEWCAVISDAFTGFGASLNGCLIDIMNEQFTLSPTEFDQSMKIYTKEVAEIYDDDTSISILRNVETLSQEPTDTTKQNKLDGISK